MSGVRIREGLGRLPRYSKQFALMAFDTVALTAVAWLSYSLRFDRIFVPTLEQALVMLAVPIISIPIFVKMGLYRAVIRYLPEQAIWTIFKAVSIATLIWVAIAFLTSMTGAAGVPRSIPVVFWVLATLVIAGSRFGAKWIIWTRTSGPKSAERILIYGTDEAAMQLTNALKTGGQRQVVAFVTDEPDLAGRELLGIRVYAATRLEELIRNLGVKEVIVTSPTSTNSARRELITRLSAIQSARFRILPAITDLAAGKYLVSYVRDIDINDLLGRSPVPADTALLQAAIKDTAILVTGAAGSIGSELSRAIASLGPSKLVLLDFDEHGLYEIKRSLGRIVNLNVVPVLGSACDAALVERTIRQHAVRTIYHCAAYKHVPLVEENTIEGVRNNILGTKVLTEKALECGVENFILISSDKAVRPTSVMGATKRWSELIVRHYGISAEAQARKVNFASVRFGNVLGSSGSVVPLFKEQIASGGPVTVTDEGMTRYFMSIREATELIIQASALSESGDVLMLEMGEPVSIRELAEDMIQLAGLQVRSADNPDGDVEIVTIGAREGEKLHEELFYDPESVKPTSHPKILRAKRQNGKARLVPEALARIQPLLDAGDEAAVRAVLFEYAK